MKNLIALLVVLSSFSALANEVKLADVLDTDFRSHSVSLWKIKDQYAVRVFSIATLDGAGNALDENQAYKTRSDKTTIYRTIEIPVKFDLNIEGLDKSIQVWGANDLDIKTGLFSRVENKKIESLFLEYEGSSFNLGLAVMGGGRSSGVNRDNVKFSDFNFSLIVSPPGGMGFNIGLSAFSYQLKISPVLKAALVKYQTHYVNNEFKNERNVEKVLSMDQVLNTELNGK